MDITLNTDSRRSDLPFPLLVAHQPEFIPWLGNLSKATMGDVYYLLDTVQFVKDVFQNRNKIRIKNKPGWQWLTIPILGNTTQMWNEVRIDNSQNWKRKHLNALTMSYSKTPYFNEIYPELEMLYNTECDKLIDFVKLFIKYAFVKFDINVPVKCTSELVKEGYDMSGQKSDLIINMCKSCNANSFVFGQMGRTYIDWDKFTDIKPVFQNFVHPTYNQLHGDFISNMSFIDLLMNAGPDSKNILTKSTYDNE